MHSGTRSGRSLAPAVVFRPPRAVGVIVGGGFVAWALIVAFVSLQVAIGAPEEFKTFLAWLVGGCALVLAGIFANWTYGLATLAYLVERDTLVVRWGFRRIAIPIDSILRMVPGRTLDPTRVRGLNWWGCHVGSGDVKRIGYTLFYSTHSDPDELLYIHTTQESYALTVLDQAAFAEEVQARAALGALEHQPQRSTATGLAALPFWRDRVALGAAALSVVCCAVFCGFVFARYPGLPDVIRLDFPALGGVVRVGDKSELLRMVYLGTGVLAVNTALGVAVHTRERAAGLWLLASSGMLQAVLLGAAVVAFQRG